MQKRTKGFVKIEKVIDYQQKSRKINESYWRYKAVKHWSEAASGFFEEAKELTSAVDLKNGILIVACLSIELSRKLKLFSEKIISALNEKLGEKVVFGLVVED